MKPLVSVIIPTYNRDKYLQDALISAINQTYNNIEILVTDDCSPISPQELIESLHDPRIIFERNPTNLGMFKNTINTFKRAKGRYVASLNDDDMLNPDFLEKLVPLLEANPSLSVAFCDHYIVNADGTINQTETETNTQRWKRDQLKAGIYQPFYDIGLVNKSVAIAVAAVIRKDAVDWDNLPDEAGVFWDLFTTYTLCKNDGGAVYFPERLTRYRIHETSETALSGSRDIQAKIRKAQAGIFCYTTFKNEPKFQKYQDYFQHKLAEANTSLGIALIRNNQPQKARQYLFSALREKNLNSRALASLLLSFFPSIFGENIFNFFKKIQP